METFPECREKLRLVGGLEQLYETLPSEYSFVD